MMSIDDSDPPEATRRKELARAFVARAERQLDALVARLPEFELVDHAIWRDTRLYADEVQLRAIQLQLPVLAACAGELLQITTRPFAEVDGRHAELVLYVRGALDTIALELVRLRHDRDLA
jgi:hypothetical protein